MAENMLLKTLVRKTVPMQMFSVRNNAKTGFKHSASDTLTEQSYNR